VLDGINHVAAQPGGIIHEDQVERARFLKRCLNQALQTATAIDADSADGFVSVDLILSNHPVRMPSGSCRQWCT
jgi:hypothetical protein